MQAHSRCATVIKSLAHYLGIGAEPFEHVLFTADHERQGSAFGSCARTCTGSVEKFNALGCQCSADRTAIGRPDGAAIGDHGACLRAGSHAVGSQDHVYYHGGVAHAQEDGLGIRTHLLRCRTEFTLLLGGELLRFARVMRPHGNVMSGAEQVARHGIAHDPESKKS